VLMFPLKGLEFMLEYSIQARLNMHLGDHAE
jgi:hypothetical protein